MRALIAHIRALSLWVVLTWLRQQRDITIHLDQGVWGVSNKLNWLPDRQQRMHEEKEPIPSGALLWLATIYK